MKAKSMKAKLRICLGWVISLLLTLLAIEAASQLAYRTLKGKWYLQDRHASARGMVQPHPYFGACLVPSVSDERNGIRISHNSFRCRGPEFARPKSPGRFRIVALGGSTTYGTGVSDDETWEHFLGQQLGTNYEVINMANPGGTSLEATIQSALLFSEVRPDVALYYLGWNDARVQHVKNLWPDWSDFHGRWVMSFGLSGRDLTEPLASGYLCKRILFSYFFPRMDTDKVLRDVQGSETKLTDQLDPRALGHYERNVRNIIALCQKQGVRPIFIPQVMNYPLLTSDQPYGFLPFVRDKDMKKVIGSYNETLARIAREENVEFIGEVLDQPYGGKDFVDHGHFSRSGNELFARVLAEHFNRHAGIGKGLPVP